MPRLLPVTRTTRPAQGVAHQDDATDAAIGRRRRRRVDAGRPRSEGAPPRALAGQQASAKREPAAARSRAAAAGPSTGWARSAPRSRCRRSRRPTPRPGRRSRASARRCECPEREQVVRAADRRERRAAGEQRVDAERAAVGVEAGARRRAARRTRCPPRPGRGDSPPAARGRRRATSARRGTRSGGGPARRAPRPSPRCPRRCRRRPRARRAACGERWTTAAPSARIAARCRSHLRVRAPGRRGRCRRRRRAAARIERSRRTYEFSRSAIPLGAAGDDEEAGRRRRVLDAADDLREVRVGDVVDDDPDDRDAALEQPAGERVRDVVERPGRLEHPRPRRRADRVVGRRDDPRRRRRRDAGQPGDLGDGCHRASALSTGYGSTRLVANGHPLPLGELSSSPRRRTAPPLPDAPIPPNGIVASSFTVWSLTWTMPDRIRWASASPREIDRE